MTLALATGNKYVKWPLTAAYNFKGGFPEDSTHVLFSSTYSPWEISSFPNGFRCHLLSDVSQIRNFAPGLSSKFQISTANGQHGICPQLSHWHVTLYVSKMNLFLWQNCSSVPPDSGNGTTIHPVAQVQKLPLTYFFLLTLHPFSHYV